MKLDALSRQDCEHIGREDLAKGSQLLMDFKKKQYPVTVLKIKNASPPENSKLLLNKLLQTPQLNSYGMCST